MAARRGCEGLLLTLLYSTTCVVVLVTDLPRADGHSAYYKLGRLTPDEAFVEESTTDAFGLTTVYMSNGAWLLEAKEDKLERVQYSCYISYSSQRILDFLGKSTIKKVEVGALGLKEIEINCRRRRSVKRKDDGGY